MKKQYIIYSVVDAFLLIVGTFYWYEWRPTQIKKECSRKSQSAYRLDGFGLTLDERYKNCLRNRGL